MTDSKKLRDACRDAESMSLADVSEGDTVILKMNPHNGERGRYHIGTVAEEMSDHAKRTYRDSDSGLPMADIAIRTENGEKLRHNVDNHYVIGDHKSLGRRSDVGKFMAYYPSEVTDQ